MTAIILLYYSILTSYYLIYRDCIIGWMASNKVFKAMTQVRKLADHSNVTVFPYNLSIF